VPLIDRRSTPVLACAVMLIQPVIARAGSLVDFETTAGAGATPIDNGNQFNPYPIPGGTVQFFFDTNGNNTFDSGVDAFGKFENAGAVGTDEGFVSQWDNGHDTPQPGFETELGNFFLRQPDPIGNVPGPFIAAYDVSVPIRGLSGEIWDIDGNKSGGTEQWRVDVLGTGGAVLATTSSPIGVAQDNTSLDSLPWMFRFENLPDGVAAVRLTFVGSKTDGIGLAFNNFDATEAIAEHPGDANHDGHVNQVDFVILAQHFNQAGATWEQGNFNADPSVNALDFNVLATNYGFGETAPAASAAAGSPVPEPATAILAATLLLGFRYCARPRGG
jgi:dockerin type I repeat protein